MESVYCVPKEPCIPPAEVANSGDWHTLQCSLEFLNSEALRRHQPMLIFRSAKGECQYWVAEV